MTTKYFALLTNQGAAKLANAAALGTKVNITSMAVGDGGGTLPTPDPAQTKLIGEKRRAQLNSLTVDAANSSQIIAEQIIPESEGGFWIREIGLYDADGVLLAVANCAETYKPQLAEGSGRTQTVRMILIVNSTSAVTLKIDPAVVLATRQYVDNAVIEVKAYADSLLAVHLKAANPHSQYLLGQDGSAMPVGIPVPWPTATPPTGWLKCNGASFSATAYPALAKAYPGLVLPDLRGEFIRGWDDGRGVDSGRAILSAQAHMYASHAHNVPAFDAYGTSVLTPNDKQGDRLLSTDNAIGADQSSTSYNGAVNTKYATTANGGTETRPRNVAFNYIVRAA